MSFFKTHSVRFCLAASLLITIISCKKDTVFRFPLKPVVTITTGDERLLSNIIHFVKDSVYVIATDINITNAQMFSLEAGTLVKVNSGKSINVLPGGIINAKGNAAEPIIFTLNAGKGQPGGRFNAPWNGVQIFGSSNNTSGTISYVRVEFAAGLKFNNVNNLTTLHHIQVSYATFNSFEFIGSNCNASYLISFAGNGTDFNINNGFTGKLQHIFAYRYPVFAIGQNNLAGINIEGTGTEPVISNATVLGPDLRYNISPAYTLGAPNRRAGIITSGNSNFHIRNSVVLGPPAQRQIANAQLTDNSSIRDFYLDSRNTAASLDSGRSDFTYSVFYQADSNAFYLPNRVYAIPQTLPVQYYTSANLREFLLRPRYNNEIYLSIAKFNFIDPYNYYDGIPNPFPNSGSPLFSGANFSDLSVTPVFSDPFFKPVTYRGALGPDDWMKGWVNFIPLQTDYNN